MPQFLARKRHNIRSGKVITPSPTLTREDAMRLLPFVVRLRLAQTVGFLAGLFWSNVLAFRVGRDRMVWDEQAQLSHRWLVRRWHESPAFQAWAHQVDQFFGLV